MNKMYKVLLYMVLGVIFLIVLPVILYVVFTLYGIGYD